MSVGVFIQDEATGGSLPCGRYLLAPLNGNKEGSKGFMVLRVKRTPTLFPTYSFYGLHTLAFYTKCCRSVLKCLLKGEPLREIKPTSTWWNRSFISKKLHAMDKDRIVGWVYQSKPN